MNKLSRYFFIPVLVAVLLIAVAAFAEPWKFGVMADTQWKDNLDGLNPDTVAVGIIKQLNREFVDKQVKFVVQVGDLTNRGSDASLATRAAVAEELHAAGIGFFPLRGNHESTQADAIAFLKYFPQTRGVKKTFGATNFSSPPGILHGLSYSFDFENARFVLLDQFTRPDGTDYLEDDDKNILDQLPWIAAVISGKRDSTHGFVFAHKNLIGQSHTDVLLGRNPAANPQEHNLFIGTLAATPTLKFSKRESFGYCLNGREIPVAQG